MPQRLIFVRHGHTPFNSTDHHSRFMGWDDHVGLSNQGKQDALSTSSKLHSYQIDSVYHSDFIRTTETVAIITHELGLTSTPTHHLRERNLGNFDGHTVKEIMETRPADWTKFLDHADQDWNGLAGESLRAVNARFDQFMQHLKQQHSGQVVLLVTHSGIMHTILRDYFGFFPVESFIEVGHDSLTVLDRVGEQYQLTLHNS